VRDIRRVPSLTRWTQTVARVVVGQPLGSPHPYRHQGLCTVSNSDAMPVLPVSETHVGCIGAPCAMEHRSYDPFDAESLAWRSAVC
jgi:hypothetical protein